MTEQRAEKVGKPFEISRTFSVPRQKMWRAWTEAEQLKKWFGPKGFTMPRCELDLRPGGRFHYCLKSPEGQEMWGLWVFREISAPERMVMESSFSDAGGGLARHPMAPDWPLRMLSTVTFTEKDGKTTVTVKWSPLDATAKEEKMFDDNHKSMEGGWGGTFEQLEGYLWEVGSKG